MGSKLLSKGVKMRFLHTADWHLGRMFHGLSLIEDQAYVLDQLVDIVKAEKPDAVVIAGDVYDRTIPPNDAIRLLDDTLTRIIRDAGVPVILIAGNHDSPDRIGFASRLLEGAGLTVRGAADAKIEPIVLSDAHGQVAFYPMPYTDTAQLRELFPDTPIPDQQMGADVQMARLRATLQPHRRNVLIAHTYVQGGASSESERPLMLGGTSYIDAKVFDGFHFVAMGHLHRPQTVVDGRIDYSGSLLKYSFAESDHEKSVSMVELDGAGQASVTRLPLKPRRDVRVVEGLLQDILQQGLTDPGRDDYIHARLTDIGPILDAKAKVQTSYPNVLLVSRTEIATGGTGSVKADHRKIDTLELFGLFYKEMTDGELSDEAKAILMGELEAMEREERGVAA